ncbi:hypothetical protein F0L74_22105 [Chitinophaga agrisoli]|uniref:Uncharacterized protein n=1 Tax=Chitinophaga agrisoli TaxID=2607653 RepID=A0A5B2VIM1_9BACT|nr:hypothetical protein [Chitinophaga agrisoli]KAA2238911.1 hypothetical protein F0L74_22105 [Chitinophaga agrisoli]
MYSNLYLKEATFLAMKIFRQSIFLCLLFLLGNRSILRSQTKKIRFTKAAIEYESFLTSTFEAVKCQYFESTFKETITTIAIEEQKKVDSLTIMAMKMQPIAPTKSIDVRLKFILLGDGHKASYCMDRFGVFVDGDGKFFENKLLYRFIISKMLPGIW